MAQNKIKNYITPKGHQTLVDELNELVKNQRPEILKVIEWAAGNGDRSENADYIYGRKRLREIDKRANFLRKRIELAEIVDSSKFQTDIIRFGATVTIQDEGENNKTVTIVGQDEIDSRLNKISWKSPLGSNLLNKSAGDEIIVATPQGEISYTIIKFSYLEA